ncbi:MAG: hypothetical protein WBA16_05615 [Nonlabens sp.]
MNSLFYFLLIQPGGGGFPPPPPNEPVPLDDHLWILPVVAVIMIAIYVFKSRKQIAA